MKVRITINAVKKFALKIEHGEEVERRECAHDNNCPPGWELYYELTYTILGNQATMGVRGSSLDHLKHYLRMLEINNKKVDDVITQMEMVISSDGQQAYLYFNEFLCTWK